MWKTILDDLKAVVAKIEAELETVAAEIWSIFKRVFTAEEAVLMARAYDLLKQEAVTIQNNAPGTDAHAMGGQLLKNAKVSLASLESQLAVTAIITVIGGVMHDLRIPDAPGNAGVVS